MNNEDQVTEAQVEDIEVTAEEARDVKGGSHGTGAGAGKVSMNDFHFVMRNNSASPKL